MKETSVPRAKLEEARAMAEKQVALLKTRHGEARPL